MPDTPATFRSSVDELLKGVSKKEIADSLKCSLASFEQARLGEHAKAHRSPPAEWNLGLAEAAQKRAEKLLKLAKKLRAI